MKSALRAVLGVVVGLVLAMVLVIVVELIGAAAHPTPQGFKGTMEEMNEHVVGIPPWFLALGVVLWSASTFVSTWVATRIGNRWAGIAVSLVLGLAIVCNVIGLPYTLWFKVVMLCCFPVACFWGVVSGVRPISPPVVASD